MNDFDSVECCVEILIYKKYVERVKNYANKDVDSLQLKICHMTLCIIFLEQSQLVEIYITMYFLDINGALLYYQIDGVYSVHSIHIQNNILINNWLKWKQQYEKKL